MNFTLTPAAEKFIRRMLRFNGGPGYGFRLALSAGGCSGPAAEFDVLAGPCEGDAVFERGGITLFLPAESRLLFDDVTIDYAETPTHSGLVLHDPKTVDCTCKSAHAVDRARDR